MYFYIYVCMYVCMYVCTELRNYEEVVAVLRMLRPEENFHFLVDKEILAILADAKKDAAISA